MYKCYVIMRENVLLLCSFFSFLLLFSLQLREERFPFLITPAFFHVFYHFFPNQNNSLIDNLHVLFCALHLLKTINCFEINKKKRSLFEKLLIPMAERTFEEYFAELWRKNN